MNKLADLIIDMILGIILGCLAPIGIFLFCLFLIYRFVKITIIAIINRIYFYDDKY